MTLRLRDIKHLRGVRLQGGGYVAPVEQGTATTVTPLAVAMEPADKLNKTERVYRDLLDMRKRRNEIRDYAVQSVTFILGHDCRYTPDFMVIEADGTITFVEVKGFLRDDALVKFRTAQRAMPWFRFVMVQRTKDGWRTIRQ